MTIAQAITNLEVCASVAFLIWFFYGPWQNFVLDTLRQNLFEIRDEIFLLAADGKIEFSSPEYKATRKWLNTIIRFAHEITWIQILAFACSGVGKVAQPSNMKDIISQIEDKGASERILDLYRKASIFVCASILLRSLFLMVTNMVSAPIIMLVILLDWTLVRSKIERPIRDLIDRDVHCLASH